MALDNEYRALQHERERLEKEISTLKAKLEKIKTKEKEAHSRWLIAWHRYNKAFRSLHDRKEKVYSKVYNYK